MMDFIVFPLCFNFQGTKLLEFFFTKKSILHYYFFRNILSSFRGVRGFIKYYVEVVIQKSLFSGMISIQTEFIVKAPTILLDPIDVSLFFIRDKVSINYITFNLLLFRNQLEKHLKKHCDVLH